MALGARTLLMGIVNVTPDSFSDGGAFLSPENAVEHGLSLHASGADILDVGGESTRPGSDPVSDQEEQDRVLPVIEGLLSDEPDLVISIDTSKASVARTALEAGAHIINDVTALMGDPDMHKVAAEADCPVVLMHMRGRPKTMQDDIAYHDVCAEVNAFLTERVAFATDHGVRQEQLLLDPGIGFGKALEHNLSLLRNVSGLLQLGLPVVLGTSRKRFLGEILGKPVDERGWGTAATVAWAAAQGVQILRVHDVAEMRDVCDVIDCL